jgi:hypothetical protein
MLTDRLEVDKFATHTICERRRRPPICALSVSAKMNLRLLVPVAAVASLVYACGPRTHADATLSSTVAPHGFALASMAPPMGSAIVRRANARERIVKREGLNLSTQFAVQQQETSVQFDFHVINATGKRVEIKFPSGQAYDFVVVDSVGREVWRWADGRTFTQSVQNKLLGTGESISIAEKWEPAKSGKYTAIAKLHSTNFPVEQRVDFERK